MYVLSVLGTAAAEWVPKGYAPVLFAGLLLAGIGTVALFALGLAAYYRRRTREYLLVTIALGALVVRTAVGWGTAVGVVPMLVHHVVEHTLDFCIAAIILYVVYRQKPARQTAPDHDP